MRIDVRTGSRPETKARTRRGKFDAAYAAAHSLLPGQWFIVPEGKVKCLSQYRKQLGLRGVKHVEVLATADDQVVFAHEDDGAKAASPPAAPEEIRRGPGRPPGSGLKPPKVDPQVAKLARR